MKNNIDNRTEDPVIVRERLRESLFGDRVLDMDDGVIRASSMSAIMPAVTGEALGAVRSVEGVGVTKVLEMVHEGLANL